MPAKMKLENAVLKNTTYNSNNKISNQKVSLTKVVQNLFGESYKTGERY